MQRTITTTYEIGITHGEDEQAVAAALDTYRLLDRAALNLDAAGRYISGHAILGAMALIDAVDPSRPEESFDLPTLMALLADDFRFSPEDLKGLRALLPPAMGSARVAVQGKRDRVEVSFLSATGDGQCGEATFSHTRRHLGYTISGMPHPFVIIVAAPVGPGMSAGQPVRYGRLVTDDHPDAFNAGAIRAWISHFIVGDRDVSGDAS